MIISKKGKILNGYWNVKEIICQSLSIVASHIRTCVDPICQSRVYYFHRIMLNYQTNLLVRKFRALKTPNKK